MALSNYNNFVNVVVKNDGFTRGQYENINLFNSVEVSGVCSASGVVVLYQSNDQNNVLFSDSFSVIGNTPFTYLINIKAEKQLIHDFISIFVSLLNLLLFLNLILLFMQHMIGHT